MQFVQVNPSVFAQIETWATANPVEAVIAGIAAFAVFCYGNALKDALKG